MEEAEKFTVIEEVVMYVLNYQIYFTGFFEQLKDTIKCIC